MNWGDMPLDEFTKTCKQEGLVAVPRATLICIGSDEQAKRELLTKSFQNIAKLNQQFTRAHDRGLRVRYAILNGSREIKPRGGGFLLFVYHVSDDAFPNGKKPVALRLQSEFVDKDTQEHPKWWVQLESCVHIAIEDATAHGASRDTAPVHARKKI